MTSHSEQLQEQLEQVAAELNRLRDVERKLKTAETRVAYLESVAFKAGEAGIKPGLQDVERFLRACLVPIGAPCSDESRVAINLQLKCLQEELEEFRVAWLVKDEIELADAAGDIVFVALGLGLVAGFTVDQLQRCWYEICRTNYAKAVNGVVNKRSDGKIIKPKGWEPPDIRKALYG